MSEGPLTADQAHDLFQEGQAAFDSGDYETAWTTWYGLYGSGLGGERVTQAMLAFDIGECLRRMGRFSDAESWFNEAMAAPGSTGDIEQRAGRAIRQARLQNSGEHYDLDDDEAGGGVSEAQAHQLWLDGKAAMDAGDYETAWQLWYGVYGTGVAAGGVTQAALALDIGECLRRLGRFTEAESWFNEAMGAPGTDAEVERRAAHLIRQARMENSGDAYDLDDDEPGGGLTEAQAHQLWSDGKAAFDAGDYETAWMTWNGVYGTGVAAGGVTQAALAYDIGECLRRLGRFTEAESWFTEAMSAPGTNSEVEARSARMIRQARLENSGDPYDLDG